MTEFTPSATAEAMLALANQVEKLTVEVMALKYFVAAIPRASDTHHQAIRNVLHRLRKARQSVDEMRRLESVHKAIDELDGLAGEFQAQHKSG